LEGRFLGGPFFWHTEHTKPRALPPASPPGNCERCIRPIGAGASQKLDLSNCRSPSVSKAVAQGGRAAWPCTRLLRGRCARNQGSKDAFTGLFDMAAARADGSCLNRPAAAIAAIFFFRLGISNFRLASRPPLRLHSILVFATADSCAFPCLGNLFSRLSR
jgi:hypothetical protein